MKIEWILERVKRGEYYFSRHGDQERHRENLTVVEIEEVLLSGRILEQYEDTGRVESCLIVGFTGSGKPVHIVCGKRGKCPYKSCSVGACSDVLKTYEQARTLQGYYLKHLMREIKNEQNL